MLGEQYLMLHRKLADGAEGTSTKVTLEVIAATLYCTERNAKLVLRKMEEKAWITWKAGRGRGNRSVLTFLANREQLLQESARQWAEKGEYKRAFELLRTYGNDIRTNESFVEWMNGHFGFCKEQEGEQAKDSLRLPIYRTIESLDPADCVYSVQSHMIEQIFDRLVNYDNETGRYLPAIAHYWESSDDGTVWTFHLRKGILFHDGTELTAHDVKYTVERLRQGKRNGWIVRELNQVEIVTPRIVRFWLNKPNRIFIRFLSAICMSILPRHLAEPDEASYWARPTGTGPFIIETWNEERLVLHANPHYYQGRPHLDTVHIVIMPEQAMHYEVSWENLLQDEDASQADNGIGDVVTVETTEGCTSMMTWNMTKPGPYQSVLFRRAVDLVLDRKALVRELGEHRLFPARSFIRDKKTSEYQELCDPVLAQSLLEQSGYDGMPIVLGTIANHAKDAAWIKERCAEIGIPVIIREERMDTILRPDVMKEMDCIVHALVLPGEEVCLVENYEQNSSFVKELMDPALREWVRACIDCALASRDAKERFGHLKKIEDRMREEAQILFLAHTRFYAHLNASYKGIVINRLGWLDFRQIWRV
ncbi:ABC transporter substrate-binding protein [Paenibacillus ihbetae]|uniref:ABC transporter substrate-binding protein n=1 Tax=Paenibacillus ihbetae TaxID=1870820 RepID=A0ABX3JW00_9BACL|nr:ABC transporter substrate-binding protein [Paenibacillus ihbetae]OOC61835.1 ABC transporter substrate-binding protein [Paenibacillus ihbetae]